jgi:acetylornithine deacetylase/succinyl-diaminopimelate desuccinylase-like protein
MPRLLTPLALAAALLAVTPAFPQAPPTPAQQKLREIYKELVEINTTDSAGDCTKAAEAMAARLRAAGFPEKDVLLIVPPGNPKKGNLVARLHGSDPGKKPILMLAHIDVVEARREDWERDPFRLVEENGEFYARGASDDKAMAAIFVANLIRYRQEGYRPESDVVLALTADEEADELTWNGVDYLIKNRRDLIDARIALNEGAAGRLDKEGHYVRLAIQAGEKIFQNYRLEATNRGGHSSVPRKDNAIYRLADGLARLSQFDFPVLLSPVTRAYFERMASIEKGQTAADMKAILQDPPDPIAIERLSADPFINATLRTTCVATMLDAGHASNALPQRARATVNCRILPGTPIDEVTATLRRAVNDDEIHITLLGHGVPSPAPPLTPELMKTVEAVAGEIWPGVPVVPTLSTGATDGRLLNAAGVPTYGLSGLFHDPDGSGAHGLNEHIRVRSLYEGEEFLYRVVKRLAGP